MSKHPETTLTTCRQALDWNRDLFEFSPWTDAGERDPGLAFRCGLVLPDETTVEALVVETNPGQFDARVLAFDEDEAPVMLHELPGGYADKVAAQRDALRYAAAWCLFHFTEGTL